MRDVGRCILGLAVAGLLLSGTARAGFGFGFSSEDGFYDFDPERYPNGYPPPEWRRPDPRWSWGSSEGPSTWRFGSTPAPRRPDADTRWERSWSFGDRGDDHTSRFSFGPQRFHFGDRWTPSFGDRWGKGRYRDPYAPHPGWGWAPPPRPGYAPPPPGWWPYPPPPRPGARPDDASSPSAEVPPRPPARAPEAGRQADGAPSTAGAAAGKAAKGSDEAPVQAPPPAKKDGEKAGESAPAPAGVKA